MDLLLSESEKIVQESVRQLLAKEVPIELVHQAQGSGELPRGPWDALAAAGWFGVGASEAAGGHGTLVEWVLVLEQLGRVCMPGPVVEQLAATAALSRIGGASILPGLMSGQTMVTMAIEDRPGMAVVATPSGSGATLDGTKLLAPYGAAADRILVRVGNRWYDVDAHAPGVVSEGLHTLSRNQHTMITFNGVQAEAVAEASTDPSRDLMELYQLARDAFAVGMIGRMLDISVSYARDRVQFGRPIGSYQAVQYHCVDMASLLFGAQALLYQATWLVEQGRPAKRELLMCHAEARESAGKTTVLAHQVHGAMGFTMEYPLQLFSRRAKAYQVSLGRTHDFREALAQLEAEGVPHVRHLHGGFP